MKILVKMLVVPFLVMGLVSCKEEAKETFLYSVSNAMQMTQKSDQLAVMTYAASAVKMSTESLMQFEGTQAEADAAAKTEFAKRLQAVDAEKFCGMIAEGEYYDFVLYRLSDEPDGAVEIDRKHYAGTKKAN